MKIKKKTINYLLLILIITLAVIQVVMLNRFSTIGEKLTEVDQKIQETEKENSRLAEKIASSSSITVVLAKAKELGLAKIIQTTSINSPLPVAYYPRLTL